MRRTAARFFSLLAALTLAAVETGATTLAPGEPLTAGVLRGLVEAALPAQPPGRRLELAIVEPRLPLSNPSERPVSLALDELSLDEVKQRFAAQLVVRVDGRVTGVLALSGQVKPLVEVPAPLVAVREGQPIEAGQLGTVWLAESQLPPDAVLAAEEIVGREAERRLAPGRPIRRADLRAPRLVRKGEVVTLLFQRAGIELTAQARALQDGAEGERIRAVNLDSERPVSGVVIARRRLLVGASEVGR